MGRPPVIPPEKKTRIVLAVLAGEISIAEAAREERVRAVDQRVEGRVRRGRQDRVGGREDGAVDREAQLEAEVAELTQALGEAAVELRVWKKSAEGRLGPSRTLR